ncbi:MAG: hypothetical protein KF870_09440 [Leadbetterella sp.]|nr:hypothetical protein [Leadbetterella sp.]
MSRIYFTAELLLGLIFVCGGINGLLIPLGYDPVMPVNPESAFAVTLSQTGYIFILQKTVELCAGILLLARRMRRLALLALTPVVICILLYHLFDDTGGLAIGISVFVLYLISLAGHKQDLLSLLK